MDASSACGFFDMLLGLFVEADIGTTGKLIGESLMFVNFQCMRMLINCFCQSLMKPTR